jgi:hypothetical protein
MVRKIPPTYTCASYTTRPVVQESNPSLPQAVQGIAFWRFPPVHKLAIMVVFGSRAVVSQKLAIDSKDEGFRTPALGAVRQKSPQPAPRSWLQSMRPNRRAIAIK